jgi:hypothetical protein
VVNSGQEGQEVDDRQPIGEADLPVEQLQEAMHLLPRGPLPGLEQVALRAVAGHWERPASLLACVARSAGRPQVRQQMQATLA